MFQDFYITSTISRTARTFHTHYLLLPSLSSHTVFTGVGGLTLAPLS
jgi:hypothetical protein